jgi:hypothetical protein
VNPGETQLYLPILIAVGVIALMGRRMLRPRRFRLTTLLIAPALGLVGAGAFLALRPAPTPYHLAGLLAALILGAALGWLRARLVKVVYDPQTGMVTQQGTPYGLMLLLGLFVVRIGVRILAAQHPEWGIDLKHATDILLLFGLGIVSGYAAELYSAATRARRVGL